MRPAERLPAPLLCALLLFAAFAAFVAWDQSHWWRVKDDYSFGWLVPAFAGFVVFDRWRELKAALRDGSCVGAESKAVGRWLNVLAGCALLLGALCFLLGAFYRAGAGPSHPGTFALTSGMVATVLPLIYFNAPAGSARHRLGVARLFLFPVAVWLISAPLVSVVESRISMFLLRKVVTVVAFVFEMTGCPVEQQGNVLLLPKGTVGVADACSGIRSLRACLFAGSFLGAVFAREMRKKVTLVVAAMACAFVMNLARSLFLTAWAYAWGPAAIDGALHDVAGYAVLGVTCLGLFALVRRLNRATSH